MLPALRHCTERLPRSTAVELSRETEACSTQALARKTEEAQTQADPLGH
jgi:hypothetical protein